MVKVIKPETGWAIVHWTGRIYIETASHKRKEAIAVFMKMFVKRGGTWKNESQYGIHKAIKVDVVLSGTAVSSTQKTGAA